MSDSDQVRHDRSQDAAGHQDAGMRPDSVAGGTPPAEKTPHRGPDVNDLEADIEVEEETIETVDPDNAPA